MYCWHTQVGTVCDDTGNREGNVMSQKAQEFQNRSVRKINFVPLGVGTGMIVGSGVGMALGNVDFVMALGVVFGLWVATCDAQAEKRCLHPARTRPGQGLAVWVGGYVALL